MPDATSPQSPSSLTDEALAWLVRIHSGHASEAERLACEAWRTQSPAHDLAYQEAEALWHEIGLPPSSGVPRLSDARPSSRSGSRTRTLRTWSLAACLVLAVGWAASGLTLPHLLPTLADYHTGTGQQRIILLNDGTRVTLNTDSAINVAFSSQQRAVQLLKGEAAFDVTSDDTRPFTVQSKEVTTRALGTGFIVHLEPRSVTVTVSEHAVQVSPGTGGTFSPLVLEEGQQVSYSDEGGLSRIQAVDLNRVSSWQRGKLIFEDQPLSTVIEELNRYRPGRILILNPALRTLKVTGLFDIADSEAALRIIKHTLQIHDTTLTSYLILLH